MAGLDDYNFNELTSKGGFASEQTLIELKEALTKENPNNPNSSKNQAEKKAAKSTDQMGKSIAKVNPALSLLEGAFNLLGNAISGATGLLISIAQMDGSFKGLVPIVDQATEMLSGFMSKIPIVGGFFSSITEAGAELTKLRLTLMDMQVNTFRNLSRAGLDLQTDMDQLQENVFDANLSMASFTQFAMAANDGLRIFGGELDKGVQMYVKKLNDLTSGQTSIGKQLALLGLGSEDVAEEFSEFIQANRFNRRMMSMDTALLAKAMTERLKNERVIAELTGKTADEQRKEQMALATDAAFQAAISGMENASEITTFVAGLSGPAQDAAKQLIAFGTITDEQTALLSSAAPGLIESIMGTINGIQTGSTTAAQGVADVLDVGRQNITDLRELTKLGIIDPKFASSLGEFYLQVEGITNQLDNNKGNFDSAKDLAANLTSTLEATTTNVETFKTNTGALLESALNLEEATGKFQSEIVKMTGGIENFITSLIGQGAELGGLFGEMLEKLDEDGYFDTDKKVKDMNIYADAAAQMGGTLFPGMTALVGEAGPELINMGNSFGEVMSNTDTQDLFRNMKGITDTLATGDISGALGQMQSMAPSMESSLQNIGGQVESKIGQSDSLKNIQTTMDKSMKDMQNEFVEFGKQSPGVLKNATADFQKQSVNYAAQNQVTLEKIEKLLNRLLPKAMSGNGYF